MQWPIDMMCILISMSLYKLVIQRLFEHKRVHCEIDIQPVWWYQAAQSYGTESFEQVVISFVFRLCGANQTRYIGSFMTESCLHSTRTTYYADVIRTSWRIESALFVQQFVQTDIRNTSKPRNIGPSWEFTGGSPSQRASNTHFHSAPGQCIP